MSPHNVRHVLWLAHASLAASFKLVAYHVIVMVALTLIKLREQFLDLQLEAVAQLHEEHLPFDRLHQISKIVNVCLNSKKEHP